MPVGIFPGMRSNNRTVRAPLNPMDKSTVVSIFPKAIDERKITISPSRYRVDAGTFDNPAILLVTSASWWRLIDEDQPLLEIPCGSNQVADAVVKDYCNGMLGCNMSSSMPGLFWIPGEFENAAEVKMKNPVAFNNAKGRQINFWKANLKFADTFWAKTNGNPLCINDEMRLAARELGVADSKEWMKDFSMMGKINCKACGAPVNPIYPVCGVCRAIIDPEKAKALNIQFAANI